MIHFFNNLISIMRANYILFISFVMMHDHLTTIAHGDSLDSSLYNDVDISISISIFVMNEHCCRA